MAEQRVPRRLARNADEACSLCQAEPVRCSWAATVARVCVRRDNSSFREIGSTPRLFAPVEGSKTLSAPLRGELRRSSSKRQEQLVVSQKAAGSNPVCAACYLDHATGLMPARRIHGSMVDGYDGRFSTFKTGFESRSSCDDNLGEWLAGCLQSSITPVRIRELSRLEG